MRQQLENVIEELRHLKELGHDGIYLQDDTLKLIHLATVQFRKKKEPGKSEQKLSIDPVKTDTVSSESTHNVEGQVASAVKSHPARIIEKPVGVHKVKIIQPGQKASIGIEIPPPPVITLPSGDKQSQYDWLKDRIISCPVCNAHVRPGKKIVIGSGNLDADIFYCGEAPGADEEVQGEVFVGPAGQLLNKIIQTMGLKRSDVYIGNIMNWRPEMPNMSRGNRAPNQEEMVFCMPYLIAQLQIVKPRVIVALGATAVNGLLGQDNKRRMGQVRGNWVSFMDIPLMITYHPSFLLHRQNSLHAKRMVWEDMLKVMEKVEIPISDKQRRYFTKS